MKALAHQIEHELQRGEWKHCAIYEGELQRFWPLQQKEREAEIASFANGIWIPTPVLPQGTVRHLRQISLASARL